MDAMMLRSPSSNSQRLDDPGHSQEEFLQQQEPQAEPLSWGRRMLLQRTSAALWVTEAFRSRLVQL